VWLPPTQYYNVLLQGGQALDQAIWCIFQLLDGLQARQHGTFMELDAEAQSRNVKLVVGMYQGRLLQTGLQGYQWQCIGSEADQVESLTLTVQCIDQALIDGGVADCICMRGMTQGLVAPSLACSVSHTCFLVREVVHAAEH
jgi:hypothetical protein